MSQPADLQLLMNRIFIFICLLYLSVGFKNPDDILFEIDWKTLNRDFVTTNNKDLSTVIGEKFKCNLPQKTFSKETQDKSYNGTVENEMLLLQPIFKSTKCSIRVESYWSYELCHQKYIRQYHPIIHLNQKQQEYFLGYNVPYANIFNAKLQREPSTIVLEGDAYPYFKIDYHGGDVCEVSGSKRFTSVLYICNPNNFADIYQITEVESCQYQVIVLTRFLCKDPKYLPKKAYINKISCFNLNTTAIQSKPKSLLDLELEAKERMVPKSNLEALFGRETFGKDIKVEAYRDNDKIVYRINAESEVGETVEGELGDDEETSGLIKENLSDISQLWKISSLGLAKLTTAEEDFPPGTLAKFLSQEECISVKKDKGQLHICYKKHIYHTFDEAGTKRSIIWGVFNEKENEKLLAVAHKNLVLLEDDLIQYYGDGSECGSSIRFVILFLQCASEKLMIRYRENNCVLQVIIDSSEFC